MYDETSDYNGGDSDILKSPSSSLIPVLICNERDELTDVNPPFCQLLGYSAQELLGKNLEVVKLSDDLSEDKCLLHYLMLGEIVEYTISLNFRAKNGKTIEAVANVIKRSNKNGKFVGKLIVLQRVYKYKSTSEFVETVVFQIGDDYKIELLKDLTKSILKNLSVSCTIISTFINKNKMSKLELMREQGHFTKNLIFENANLPFVELVKGEKQVYTHELIDVFPEWQFIKDRKYISFIGLPIFDFQKKCIGCISVLSNKLIKNADEILDFLLPISGKIGIELERIKQKQLFKESDRRYQLVFNHSTDGIIISDYKRGLIITYNKQMLELFRVTVEELENIENSLEFSPEYQPDGRRSEEAYKAYYNNAFTSGNTSQFKWRFKRNDDSEFDAEVILAPYDDTLELDRWMVIIRDITERKISEKRAKELEQLKIQELLNLKKSEELQSELDYRNRELSSNLLLDSKKNNLLSSIRDSMLKIYDTLPRNAKQEVNKIIREIDRSTNFDEEWGRFQLHFEAVHPNFFTKLSKRFPVLNAKQLRHCAYIKLGLTSKETAQLLHVAPKSIEMARYRLRKKMGFDSAESYQEFINTV